MSKTRNEKGVPLASSFPDQQKTVPDFYGHRNSLAARKVIRNGFKNKSCNVLKTILTINVFLSSQPNANEKVEEDYAFNHCAYPFFSSLPSHFRIIIASLYLLERKNKKWSN